MTTVESQTEDPSTSVDSFGKMTGLLSDEREETTKSMKVVSRRPSTTTEHSEHDDETMVHSHSEVIVPVKTVSVTKFMIIPGTVKETKVYKDASKKSMMMMASSNDNMEQQSVQLDQGSTLLLFLLAALSFCACLMASIVAIVSSLREAARLKSVRHTVSSYFSVKASTNAIELISISLFQVKTSSSLKRRSRITEMEAHLDKIYQWNRQRQSDEFLHLQLSLPSTELFFNWIFHNSHSHLFFRQ